MKPEAGARARGGAGRCALRSTCVSSLYSSVAFAHDKVQTSEHCWNVGNHVTGQQFRKNAQIHKRRRANLQPIRNAAAAAVDVKSELALGVLRAEINFARRRFESLC